MNKTTFITHLFQHIQEIECILFASVTERNFKNCYMFKHFKLVLQSLTK